MKAKLTEKRVSLAARHEVTTFDLTSFKAIEARVARIRARVAQLTGQPPAGETPS